MVYHKLQHFISKYAIPQAIKYFVEDWYFTYASSVTHRRTTDNNSKVLFKNDAQVYFNLIQVIQPLGIYFDE